jgi:hypothetical protein
MDNDKLDISGFILNAEVNYDHIKNVLFRLFVQAYSSLDDYPEPGSSRVSLLDLPELSRISGQALNVRLYTD